MKKIVLLFLLCMAFAKIFAQEGQQGMEDAALIEISAYVDPSSSMPDNARHILFDKLQKVITRNGMGATYNNRFIMTANIRELNLEKSETAPVIYLYNIEVNFYIGDGVDGTLFSSCSVEVNAAGDTKEKAYLSALKKIKVNDAFFQNFITEGRRKIIDYYEAKCDFIISKAITKSQNQDFDGAIYDLIQVPAVCRSCFDKCMSTAQTIYQEKIDQEGSALLAEARSVWSAGQDYAAAESAVEILSMINPQSSAFSSAEKLNSDIAKRIKEIDNREWSFMLKQQQDAVDIQKARIKATRDVGVAYGNHQQPKTYNIRTWW